MKIIQGLLLALVVALCAIPGQVRAQASVSLYCWNPTGSQATNNQFTPCNAANPLVVSASVSASITGFPGSAQTTGTPFTATTGGITGTLPAGTEVVVSNTGTTNTAFCKLGASASVGDQPIPPNSWFGFTVGTNTQVTCITSASTTGINMVGGSGLPTGSGGGGGGGSSGAVFGPTAVGSANANPPVVIGGTVTGAAGQNVEGVAVKPASTAPLATDFALVTVESPNSPVVSALMNVPITQAHGCLVAGYGIGSCIGQVDDDIKTLNTTAGLPIPVIAGTLPSTQTPVTTGSTTKAQSDLNGNLYSNPVSQYPAGSTPITASATGTTGATTATLTGTSTTTVYICTYSIRANATAAATVSNTITGVITGTLTHTMWVAPLASGLGVDEQLFTPCVPASGTNQAIAAVSGAPGSGGTVSVTATGYYK